METLVERSTFLTSKIRLFTVFFAAFSHTFRMHPQGDPAILVSSGVMRDFIITDQEAGGFFGLPKKNDVIK